MNRDVYGVNNGLSYAYSAEGLYDKALDHANVALTQATSAQNKSKASHLQAAQYIKELKEMTPTSKIRFAWLFARSGYHPS